jgi:hypothetical protein
MVEHLVVDGHFYFRYMVIMDQKSNISHKKQYRKPLNEMVKDFIKQNNNREAVARELQLTDKQLTNRLNDNCWTVGQIIIIMRMEACND